MAHPHASSPGARRGADADPAAVVSALPFPVVALDDEGAIRFVNGAAEQFFGHGAATLVGTDFARRLPADSPLLSLVSQVRTTGATVSEHDIAIDLPPRGTRRLTVQAAPFGDDGDMVVVSIQEHSIARDIDRQLFHRSAARSVSALAAMLAHEVKNPLSGIRGAAQLMEQTVDESDRQLTRLICEETDRICALIDDMGLFDQEPVFARGAVNIHEVLERVRQIAEAGFARHVRFVEQYDPSLPAVYGNRDQLIQVFLNLVKNAAEAAPASGGEVVLKTAFQHGVRLALPGGERRVVLPLLIGVQDNGAGIADEISAHLFDPFVGTKAKGSGLGLALVAKIVGDHGGIVEFDSAPGRTEFRVMMPMAEDAGGDETEHRR